MKLTRVEDLECWQEARGLVRKVYSRGDAGVPKEYIEVFAGCRMIRLDDFRRLTVTRRGKSAQDKGQRGLVAGFLEAARGKHTAPIPLSELVAVTPTTLAIEELLRTGSPIRVEPPVRQEDNE